MTRLELESQLLHGFRFECLPGCGLCCFAEPAVDPEEAARLKARFPGLTLLPSRGGFGRISSRPNGGACSLLEDLRCRGHALRPYPCRTFPVTVHLGMTPQAALVLSCPGLNVGALARRGTGGRTDPPVGLESERTAAEEALVRPGGQSRAARASRRWSRTERQLRRDGAWDLDAWIPRAAIDGAIATLSSALPGPLPPRADEGFELLPLTYDERLGRIAFAASATGWSIHPLDEARGGGPAMGRFQPPASLPKVAGPGVDLLRGYLAYVVDRASFLGQAMHRLGAGEAGTVSGSMESDLGAVAAGVVARGYLLDQARGITEPLLGEDSILRGIRAMDAEVLDRPSVGEVL